MSDKWAELRQLVTTENFISLDCKSLTDLLAERDELERSRDALLAACKVMRKWLVREGGWSDALEENGVNAAIAEAEGK